MDSSGRGRKHCISKIFSGMAVLSNVYQPISIHTMLNAHYVDIKRSTHCMHSSHICSIISVQRFRVYKKLYVSTSMKILFCYATVWNFNLNSNIFRFWNLMKIFGFYLYLHNNNNNITENIEIALSTRIGIYWHDWLIFLVGWMVKFWWTLTEILAEWIAEMLMNFYPLSEQEGG